MIRKRNNKRSLYESIMRDVAKTLKSYLNENELDPKYYKHIIDDETEDEYYDEKTLDDILMDENISSNSLNISKLVNNFINDTDDIISQCELVDLGLDTAIEIGIYKYDDRNDINNELIELCYLDEDINKSKKIFALASRYPKRLAIDINTHLETLDKNIDQDLFTDLSNYLQKKYRNKIVVDDTHINFVHIKPYKNIRTIINLTLQVLQDFVTFLNNNY